MTVNGPSKSWEQIGSSHADILASAEGWSTFRQTIASRYFTDANYTEKDVEAAYDYLVSHGVKINETDFVEGSPVHIVKNGKIITQDLLISASELHSIEEVVDMKDVKTMVEIGGGYGRMALLVLQRYPHIQYTIVNVSPALDVARRFLTGKFKVNFLFPKEAEDLKNIDLFYSSSVLSELDREKVNFYFDLVAKAGHFFYLKDWKWGHHMNDVPPILELILRIVNKLSHIAGRGKSQWVRKVRRGYAINENNYPSKGWKELLHRDCESVTGYAPQMEVKGASGFFEIVYKI